jgi:hypothetical protein
MFSGISRFFFAIPQKQNGLKIFFSWQDLVKGIRQAVQKIQRRGAQ